MRKMEPRSLDHCALGVFAWLCVGLCTKASESAPPQLVAGDVIPLVRQCVGGIKSIAVSYSLKSSSPTGSTSDEYRETGRWIEDFESNKTRSDCVHFFKAGSNHLGLYTISTWDGQRQITWERLITKPFSGNFPSDAECEAGGRARIEGRMVADDSIRDWLHPTAFQIPLSEYFRELDKNGQIAKDETTGNHVLSLPSFQLWVDEKKFYPTKYQSFVSTEKESRKLFSEVVGSQFFETKGRWFPAKIVKRYPKQSVEIEVKKEGFMINEDVSSSVVPPVFPAGCRVSDVVANKTYVVTGVREVDGSGTDIKSRLEEMLDKAGK